MRLARIFFAVFVVSLFVGVNSAFNGKSSKIETKESQEIVEKQEVKNEEDESTEKEEVVETVVIPKELEETFEHTNNTNSTFEQQNPQEEKQNITKNEVLNTNTKTETNNYVQNTKEPEKNEEKPQKIVDNSVDTSSLDYNEHKGRIDCGSPDECMNIALPIQFRFKQSMTNSFFIEVMSNSGNSLGYFIEYVFKENTYSSNEECEKIGSEIKQTLSDRVISYQCNGSTLKINTDY